MSLFVSVIVTACNQAAYLKQAVESVLVQSHSALECLIIDDGSTDETGTIAQALARFDSRVQYFYKPNGGIASARNYGIQRSKGDWIQFLDADDWLHPDKIHYQLTAVAHQLDSEFVIYSDYARVYTDRYQQISHQHLYYIGNLTKSQLVQRLLICPDLLAETPFPLLQQAMLFKATLFKQVAFNETLQACEDRELLLELLLRDISFIYVPFMSAFYRKHSTNMTDNDLLMRSSYIRFYNLAQQKKSSLRALFQPGVVYSLERSIAEKDKLHFDQLCELAQFPLYLNRGRLKISGVIWLKLLYGLRQIAPSGLLYEQYRGPRSRKLVLTVSHLMRWLATLKRA